MSPEHMLSRLLAASEKMLQAARSNPSLNAYAKDTCREQAERTRVKAPAWVHALYHSTVKIRAPKVLRTKAQYSDNMCATVDGLYVVAQAYLILPDGKKHKIMNLAEVAGFGHHGRSVPIPRLAMSFHLDNDEVALIEKDVELSNKISQLSNILLAPLLEACEEAKRLAPEMVSKFRAGTVREDMQQLATQLLPVLDDNPLAALSADSLSLIFRTPWRELERIVGFLKANRVLAGGADPESVEYILRLIEAKKVMDS